MLYNLFVLECDMCVDTLLNSTLDISEQLTNHWIEVGLVKELQERDTTLLALEPKVNNSLLQMNNLLGQLTQLQNQLEVLDLQNITDVSSDLETAVSDLLYVFMS